MVRLPEVREIINVSVSELGILLFIGAVGALTGILSVGKFVAHRGTKLGILVGMSFWGAGMILVAWGIAIGSPILYAVGNFVSGIGAGFGDMSINVDGSSIEQKLGKAALPKMHAAFSIGALSGAGIGTVAIGMQIPIWIQVIVLALLCWVIPMSMFGSLPKDNGIHTEEEKQQKARHWFNKVVLFLGLGIFGMSLGEGASNDWLAIGLVDDYKADEISAGIGFAILVGSMTIVRFFGGPLIDRFGKAATLRVTGLIGIVGLLLLIAKISVPFAWLGAFLWGVGVALAFPLFLSAAGEQQNPAQKVAAVGAFGYTAFLVGPPLLGFVGQQIGVVNMYWLVVGFITLSVLVSGAAGNTKSAKAVKG
jgi:fucose permease